MNRKRSSLKIPKKKIGGGSGWGGGVRVDVNEELQIISLIETSQSIGGAKREYPWKTT